jgi:8-oxo-dGTP pyrophosphatase MutT (NUDIX family)
MRAAGFVGIRPCGYQAGLVDGFRLAPARASGIKLRDRHKNNKTRISVFLNAKSVQQVAAMPFVPVAGHDAKSFEVLLITSRKKGRWLLPKGWPKGKTAYAQDAAREAHEEAGVIGPVQGDPIGDYTYAKSMRGGYPVRSHVFVYPLLVCEHRLDWPERDQRSCRWAGLTEAANLVEDKGLSRLFRHLSGPGENALYQALASLTATATTPSQSEPVIETAPA